MNEQNVKALFMAQYLGQGVYMHPDFERPESGGNHTRVVDTIRLQINWVKKGYLLLRSVSQLTDEEYAVIGNLTFPGNGTTKFAHLALEAGREIIKKQRIGWSVYQYLQRLGVLTSFTYLNENDKPVTLQPDEIIAKGWAKLV